jgi:membrane associated rhomboid family serine protease
MPAAVPPAILALLIANAAAFLLLGTAGDPLFDRLALWPLGTYFQPWQVLTYAFLHGGTTHLIFNMLTLYMFGSDLEQVWGTKRFVVFYLASVLAAAGAQLAVTYSTGESYRTVGASGGVYGILLAFAVHFPRRRMMLLFPPIPMPAWLLVTLFGIFELTLGVTNSQDGIAHFAHLGGMLGGAIVLLLWRTRRSPTAGGF